MQRASSLVQQGNRKHADARHVSSFISSTALFSCLNLGVWFSQRPKRAATRAATPSPTQAKLNVAGTRCKPGVPSTPRGSFCSWR